MIESTLFDPHPPDPGNDAAPRGGGAGVNDQNSHHDRRLARLPLTPPARHNAPPGTSEVAADRIAVHAAKQRAEV